MPTAACYARVSTQDQAKHGYSLPDQISACRERLIAEGYNNIVEYIDDGYSGEFLDRPALERLRDDIANGLIAAVIMYDPDRMSRDLTNQLILAAEFDKAGVKLKFVTGDYDASPEGKLFFAMKGAVSDYEKGKIRERSMRGKRRKAHEGKLIQDFGLFGYDWATDTYTINEQEASIIREIFRLVTEKQLSVQSIQRELKQRVIPSPKGNALWPASSIWNILTNPTYTGTFLSMKTRYKKTGIKQRKAFPRPQTDWIEIPVPPIIDRQTFDLAQQQLKRNKYITKKPLSHPYLLSGIIYCGVCGRRMVAHHSIFRDGRYVPYYACCTQRYPNLRNAGIKCAARSLPANAIDADIWEEVKTVILNPDKAKKYLSTRPPKKDTTEIERLSDLESELIKKRETIARWYRQQMLSEKETEEQLSTIRKQLETILARKKELTAGLAVGSAGLEQSAESLKAIISRDDLSDDEKRTIIRTYLKKITVTRTDNHKGSNQPPIFKVLWELI